VVVTEAEDDETALRVRTNSNIDPCGIIESSRAVRWYMGQRASRIVDVAGHKSRRHIVTNIVVCSATTAAEPESRPPAGLAQQ
jgi:hypothetical protein